MENRGDQGVSLEGLLMRDMYMRVKDELTTNLLVYVLTSSSIMSSGYSVFAIGVSDVDFVELQEIGSKPSDRHVFVVDDFDAFDTIKENLITFICETATSSKFEQNLLQQNILEISFSFLDLR